MPGFVYLWINKTNGKRYVGSHRGSVDDGYVGSGKHFRNAVNKYGIENFDRIILYQGPKFRRYETLAIIHYGAIASDDFYNLSHVDDGFCEHSDETRAKISSSVTEAMNRPEVKAKLDATRADPEWKAKISAAATEAHARPEVKAKRAATYADPEWKAKKSAALTEAQNRPETKAKRAATDALPETKARRSAANKEAQNRPEVKSKKSASLAVTNALPKTKARRSASQNRPETKAKYDATYADPEWKARRSASATESNNRPEVKAKMSTSMTGNVFWNNGTINKRSKTCPGPDFVRGMLKKSHPH